MTREEKEASIIDLIAQPGNLGKLLRKNIEDSLPEVPEEVLDEIIAIIQGDDT